MSMYDCAICSEKRCEHVIEDADSQDAKIEELTELVEEVIFLERRWEAKQKEIDPNYNSPSWANNIEGHLNRIKRGEF